MINQKDLSFLEEYFTDKANERLPEGKWPMYIYKNSIIEFKENDIRVVNFLEDHVIIKISPKTYNCYPSCAAFCGGASKEVIEKTKRTMNPEPTILAVPKKLSNTILSLKNFNNK